MSRTASKFTAEFVTPIFAFGCGYERLQRREIGLTALIDQ
jgi:hypothetical protein